MRNADKPLEHFNIKKREIRRRDLHLEDAKVQYSHFEKKLKASQESFKMLFEYAQDAYYLNDLSGNFVDGNKAVEEITGYKREELIGQNLLKLNTLPLNRVYKAGGDFLKSSHAHITESDEIVLFRKDGRPVPIELTTHPVNIDNQTFLLNIARDISKRKKTEGKLKRTNKRLELKVKKRTEELSEANQKLRQEISERIEVEQRLKQQNEFLNSMVESLAHPFYVIDVEDNTIKLANSAANFGELSDNSKCYALTHQRNFPCNGPDHPCPIKEVKRIKKPVIIEHLHFDKDNNPNYFEIHAYPIIDAKGNVTQMIEYCLNITDRKDVEQALLESEERYRQFFEYDLTGDFIATPEGDIIICNPAYSEIFGFESVDEAQRCNFFSLFNKKDDSFRFLELLKREKKLDLFETKLHTRDRKPVQVIANVFGTFNDDNEIVNFRGYILDITERKKLEEQFHQAQKMEAIGQLAGGIAHDFNNILTAVSGFAELSLINLTKNVNPSHYIQQILKSGERAQALVAQLLAFSRKQMMKAEILDINSIISSMSKMLRRLIGEDIKLIFKLSDGLSPIQADPGQMEQIIINLVINARDAILELDHRVNTRKIVIETSEKFLDGDYVKTHVGSTIGHHVQIAVRDTGCGIDNTILDKIFEPFFSTKEQGKGTGLGLSTVYGIVKQNKGSIYTYSETGKGTTLKINWPCSIDTETIHNSIKQTSELIGGHETILVVEDNKDVSKFVQSILGDLGYTILTASNGKEALNIFSNRESSIDLLFTDMVMPEMGGKELADKLLDKYPNLKVLFSSGYTETYNGQSTTSKENIKFIQKPFDAQNLAAKIRQVLDQTVN